MSSKSCGAKPPHGDRNAAQRTAAEREVLLAVRALVDRVRALYRELEDLTDMPIGVLRALTGIEERPGANSSELASMLGLQRPAMSQTLRIMLRRGLVTRVREVRDQRAVQIHLTAEGRRILRISSGRAVDVLKRAVCSLDDADLGALASALPSLLHRLPDRRTVPSIVRARMPSAS